MRVFGAFKIMGLLLLLQACTATKPDLDAPTETDVTRTLRTTFDYLYDNYYEEIRLEDVVIPGLANLNTLEPDLRIVDIMTDNGRRRTHVRLGDETIYKFHKPSWYAGDGWAAVTREAIKALMANSPNVDNTSWVEAVDAVLQGTTTTLDGNTVYLSRSELKAVGLVVDEEGADKADAEESDEARASAGIRLRDIDGTPRIVQVRRNSAAAQAGLRAGDIIEDLNGQQASEISRLQMGKEFAGEPGSTLSLRVLRPGTARAQEIELTRETVNFYEPITLWRNDILYLQVTSLWGDTVNSVRQTLKSEREKQSDRVSGIVLDLRGTFVGNAFAASFFMDIFNDGEKHYFSTDGQSIYSDHRFRSREKPEDTEIPLVILANGATAGVAEAMVAAFQDSGRAVVLGTATHGQGRLQDGGRLWNGGLFAFTQSILYSAAGHEIDKRGVLPMVCSAALGSGETALALLRSGKGRIDYPTRASDLDSEDAAAIEAHRGLCPPRITQDDNDLEIAEAILKDPSLYAEILARDQQSKQAAAQ